MAINWKLHDSIGGLPTRFVWQWSELPVKTFLTTFAIYVPAGDAIDMGANKGIHTWTLGNIVKNTGNTLISVEPDSRNLNSLKEIQSTNWFNMNIITQPVSNIKKDVYFHKNTDSQLSTIVESKTESTIIMQSITLDEISEGYIPKFIKMDIENQEINAIKGGQNTIIENRPIIAMEYGTYPEEDREWQYNFFKNQNYTFLDLFGDKFTEKEWAVDRQYYWNRFLIPSEYDFHIYEFKKNLKVLYSIFNLDTSF